MRAAKEELENSPVATVCAVVSTVVAVLSLALAWWQFDANGPAGSFQPQGYKNNDQEIYLFNLFLIIAYFLSITTASALLIRKFAKNHDLSAVFVSVPIVAMTNFSTILVIYLVPPRALSAELFAYAHDLVRYSSIAIFVSVCGRALLKDLFATVVGDGDKEGELKSTDSSTAILVVPLLLLLLWSVLVHGGQLKLSKTFLPEITHAALVEQVTPNK